MIITVDGPAAAGKGTLARRLAEVLQYDFLDTGSLYRAVGLQVLRLGGNPADATAATSAAGKLELDLLTDPALRSEAAAQRTVLHAGRLLDVRSGTMIRDARVVIQAGRISAIDSRAWLCSRNERLGSTATGFQRWMCS